MFQSFKGLSTASRTLSVFLKRNISVGQAIPKAELTVFEYKNGAFDKQTVSSDKLFGKGKYILVGFPGAFTPTCTSEHVPEYIEKAAEIKKGGVDKVYALTVNDPFVVKAFAEKLAGQEKLAYIADSNGDFTKALDAGADLSAAGLGFRSRRFSMYIKDGKVEQFNDEKSPKMTELSKVPYILNQLKNAAK